VPTLGLPLEGNQHRAHVAPPSASELLFLERARAVRPGFAAGPAHQAAIAQICQRLEGLPLAIELAAAHARTISPGEILHGLSRRLDLLARGPSDLPPRQRSMRGALDWSYQLLSPAERSVLQQLAIFAGGATLPAIAAVCTPRAQPENDLRQTLAALAGKSLVGVAEVADASRFTMLEVVREYALDLLAQHDGPANVDRVRRAHASYFAAMADGASEALRGPDQLRWLTRLEADHSNFRTALEWSLARGEPELAGRLCAGLWPFWRARGYLHEGRLWLTRVLASGSSVRPSLRAEVLNGAGVLAILQSDYDAAEPFLTESRELFLSVGDRGGGAHATSNLGWAARDRMDPARAESLFEHSLRVRREIGDRWGEAWSLNNLGVVAIDRGDLESARALLNQSVVIFRQLGDSIACQQALNNLGHVVQDLGDFARAQDLYAESLSIAQQVEHARGVANNLSDLAVLALYRGDYSQARDLFEDGLALYADLGERRNVAACLEGLAGVVGVQGQAVHAARLFGLAAAVRDSIGAPLLAADRPRYESTVAAAREQLDDGAWTRAWCEGQASSVESELALLE
jgi:predicted ATPase